MKQNLIIGLIGRSNSGKDTAASMINYIIQNGTAANYGDWCIRRNGIKPKNIIHFADPLKDCLSIMFNINRDVFDDRNSKDNLYYVFKERRFINKKEVKDYKIIDNKILSKEHLCMHIGNPKSCITLRTLMQYFGTDICRNYLDNYIWINATMNKAINLANIYNVCIIADVRFFNEAYDIRVAHKGILIKLLRNEDSEINHISEDLDVLAYDYDIDNNGSLQKLFYNLLEIIQNL